LAAKRKYRRRVLSGIGASPGLAMGPARLFVSQEYHVPTHGVAPDKLAAEIKRFRQAMSQSRDELVNLRAKLKLKADDPADQILASHQMILQDRELIREIVMAIKSEQMNAAHAVRRIFQAKAHYLESLSNELFRARAADIIDVKRRVIRHILSKETGPQFQIPQGSILVASEITPSDTALMDPTHVVAFVTERGTLVSHVTIMARSRGVPAVIGLHADIKRIDDNVPVIVDGDMGTVIVAPNRKDIARYKESSKRENFINRLLVDHDNRPIEMLDGKSVSVRANIGGPEDSQSASLSGAEGIGLFRSEFFFMGKIGFPDEMTQAKSYEDVIGTFPDAPVTIRTLDLGGDKTEALMGDLHEDNPFLGLRGIRFCLEHKDIFITQLRAILRASVLGNVRILLPMISSLEELRNSRELVRQTEKQLASEGVELGEPVPVGVMIEVPSAVFMSDQLALEADFFSIGSNDLIQYTLAVDRGNERIAPLYDFLNPAVLRAIRQTVVNAHEAGIEVGSCGEMSGEMLGLLLLIGMGVDEISVVPSLVKRVKALLTFVSAADLETLANRCLAAGCVDEVRQIIQDDLGRQNQFSFEYHNNRFVCQWHPDLDAEPSGKDSK